VIIQRVICDKCGFEEQEDDHTGDGWTSAPGWEHLCPECSAVEVGSVWKRNPPGREIVRVERVWNFGAETLVRAHPVRGGKPLVASIPVFLEGYSTAALDGADHE
jgi:Zn ribbon nucleic-acid-binding protein